MPGAGDGSKAKSEEDSFLRAIAEAPGRAVEGMPDSVPGRIAHFRITGRLGSGGMGVVCRAEDDQLRREVALKLLPGAHARDSERRQRFLREARAAASLVHPNVAVVYQVGETEGRVYIAMELVEGVTLRHRFAPGGLAPAVARRLALQIGRGLAAAHAKGIVHRDLKPENVMVTSDGVVKLLDFGLAKSGWAHSSDSELAAADTESQITREGQVLGSSAYMSPEQTLGMAVDARSDVFAFGIVLYEMLAGVRPFGGTTLGELRGAIAQDVPVPLRKRAVAVAPGLEQVVMRCLQKKPAERFANAGAVVEALEALGSVESRTSSRAPELGSGRARRVALFAALAVLGGGAFWLWRPGATPRELALTSSMTRLDAAPGAAAMTSPFAALPPSVASSPPIAAIPPSDAATPTPRSPARPGASGARSPRSPNPITPPAGSTSPVASAPAPVPAPSCTVAMTYDAEGQPHFSKVCK